MIARSRSLLPLLFVCMVLMVLVPAPAAAQFYGALYLGGNATRPADVTIRQPATGTDVTFHHTTFSAKPLQSPQYYGVRLGRLLSEYYGVEVEFIHLKVIANTAESFAVSGTVSGVPVTGRTRMDTLVQRYSMTHGLNFLLVNFVARQPLTERLDLIGRTGVGPTFPHAESTIRQVEREQYEYAGLGAHAAWGVDWRFSKYLSAVAEYKLTLAKPTIDIPEGTGRVRTVTNQFAAGLAFRLPR